MDHGSEIGTDGAGRVASEADLRLGVPTSAHAAQTRTRMRDWLRQRLPLERVDEVMLACGEAIDNALEHGRPPITVGLSWSGGGGGALTVVVRDGGRWRVVGGGADRGMGIPIMMALMDSLTIETSEGTTVSLSRRF
jgi:serine/threonine-protein kinase RsbW